MDKENRYPSAIHKFIDDNKELFSISGSQLHKYVKSIAQKASLPCGVKHIKVTLNEDSKTVQKIEVDDKCVIITRQVFQPFKRFIEKPQPYVEYSECKNKRDAQFRSIIPELFVCWYLDHKDDKRYNWRIFCGETDYIKCVEIIKNSYNITKKETESSKVQEETHAKATNTQQLISELSAEYIFFDTVLDNAYNKYKDDSGDTSQIDYLKNNIKRHYSSVFININAKDSVDEQKLFFVTAAKEIVVAVNQQPLMAYLYNKSTAYLNEYRNLMYSIARYDKGKIVVSPPVETLYEKLKRQINQLAIGKCYSAHDLLCTLGNWAESASNNKEGDYYITDTSSKIKGISIETIKKESSKKSVRLFEVKNGKYKFALKQYRLIFWAMKKANDFNMSLKNNQSDIDCIVDDITQIIISHNTETNSIDHTVWAFDDLIVFSEALRMDLDGLLVYDVTNKLVNFANDFSVANRRYQEQAIAILSYMLCENHFLETEEIKRIFAIYTKSIYKFQVDAWSHLQRASKIYTEIIKYARMKACEIQTIDNASYSCADPQYIFYYGDSYDANIELKDYNIEEPENFLRYCCVLQSDIWKKMLCNVKPEIDDVKAKLEKPLLYIIKNSDYEKLNTEITYKTPYLVYGCNMLFYTVFDCIRHGVLDMTLFMKLFPTTNKTNDNSVSTIELEQLSKLILFNDYMTRKLSKPYNEDFCSFNQSMKSNVNNSSLMLLCSSFRLTSLPSLIELLSSEEHTRKYDIRQNKEMEEKFSTYLSYETGRFRILLTRLLLLCSNYFDDKDLPITSQDLDGEPDKLFLEYDSISVEKVKKMKTKLKSELDNVTRKKELIEILLKT